MLMNIFIKMLNFQIIMSSIITMFLNNILLIWLFMEISMMSFFLKLSMNNKKSFNYFIIQVMTSFMMLMYIIMNKFINLDFFLMMSFFLKIGIYPLSWWIPNIFKLLSVNEIFYLNTWIKIPPMILFMNFMNMNVLLMIFINLNLIFSTIMNLKQNNFKKILAYSSMFHSSLLLILILIDLKLWMFYFFIYLLVFYMLMNMLNLMNFKMINFKFNSNFMILLMIYIFLYSSLPIFSFFFMKWMMIGFMNIYMLYMNILIMFLSYIMMFSYLRLCYMYMYINKYFIKMNNYSKYMSMYSIFILFLWLIFMLI